MWRIALLIGTIVAVGLFGAATWRDSATQVVPDYGNRCVVKPTGTQWRGACVAYNLTGYTKVHTHADQARYLRYAAGGAFLITLASLPLLGVGRPRSA